MESEEVKVEYESDEIESEDSLGLMEEERILVKRMEEEEEDEEEQSKGEGNEEDECLSIDEDNDCKMQQLVYHNDLLLFRLEQAEKNEELLCKEMELLYNAQTKDTKKRNNKFAEEVA